MRLPTGLGLIGLILVFPMRCWVQEKAPDWQGKTAFAQKTLGVPTFLKRELPMRKMVPAVWRC
jgi:hypothetical protein